MSFVKRRQFLWILFFVGIALAAVVANATTLARLNFDQLAQQSTAVARLRCLSAESYWAGGEIWTETRFQVIERHKGVLTDVVTVRMLGGRVGNIYSHVEGVPVFRAGEEAYLFLWGKEGEPYRVLGWSLGTFRIEINKRDGTGKVTQQSASTNFDPRTHEFHHEGIRDVPLDVFRDKLQKALGKQTP